jgi:hypothetical protein
MRLATRDGLSLIAGGCLPFAAGAVVSPTEGVGFMPPCPFRTITGLPCPLCGATRAFTHLMHGTGDFTSYNAFWVVVAAAAIVAGIVVLLARRPFIDALIAAPRRGAVLLALLGGAGWAYALAERATIAPPS